MSFFNSVPVRITLAVLGGALYALLTYALVISLPVASSFATLAAFFVYLLYLGSRLLLLYGIDSPYYRREREGHSPENPEINPFYDAAQWVWRFYHHHDVVLFSFLGFLSLVLLVSIVMDGAGGNPWGQTIQSLLNTLWPIP